MSAVQGDIRPQASMWDYDGFVELAKLLKQSHSDVGQQEAALQVLLYLTPKQIMWVFGALYRASPAQACEFFAWGSAIASAFLVGPSVVEQGPVHLGAEEARTDLYSTVKIRKCRFLTESGDCVGMCTNMCKIPAQRFFAEHVGVPVSMEPNFEDGSCKMVFGKTPPAAEDDEALQEPCKKSNCSVYQDFVLTGKSGLCAPSGHHEVGTRAD
ncbi:unnamed protein product [Pedinophyceae sp. YPF-701]|nr:unnamed protein product [Pedinophyceae sp. YPF-701]